MAETCCAPWSSGIVIVTICPGLTGARAEEKSFLGFSTQFSHPFNDSILKILASISETNILAKILSNIVISE